MGRNAKPIQLHLLEGKKSHMSNEQIDKRKEAEESLQFRDDKIVPPNWLRKEAKPYFKKLVKEFDGLNIIKNVDSINLALYCDALYDYITFTEIIEAEGYMMEMTNKAKATNNVPHPLITKKAQVFQQMNKIASDFGLSPAARSKLAMNIMNDKDKEDDNPFSGRV